MEQAGELITASLAPASRAVYRRALQKYALFCNSLNPGSVDFFPASTEKIMLFISHMFSSGLAPSSMQTYTAAVCFFNKLLGGHDYSGSFVIQRMLKGALRKSNPATPRAPITTDILHKLLTFIPTYYSTYDSSLYQAMFSLAFHAFLRVGEFTIRAQSSPDNKIVQFSDIAFPVLSDKSHALQLTLRFFKGNTACTPFTLLIQPHRGILCPVKIMAQFIKLRGTSPGPLFRYTDAKAISRSQFNKILKQALESNGITAHIKPHSFRIGAATSACAVGIPDDTIQRLGRWKSDAYKRYIRMPQLTLQ